MKRARGRPPAMKKKTIRMPKTLEQRINSKAKLAGMQQWRVISDALDEQEARNELP